MRSPPRRRCSRTPTWKNTGSRVRDGALLLARARGREPVRVALPATFAAYPASAYKQIELVVWDRAGRGYHWHVTLQDGAEPAPTPGSNISAVDVGAIHPAVLTGCSLGAHWVLTDGTEAVVVTARRLRAARQYTAQRLAELPAKQSAQTKGSSRWQRLQRRKKRFLAQQERRTRAIEHKVSRAVVDYAVVRKAGTIALGDVRDVRDVRDMRDMRDVRARRGRQAAAHQDAAADRAVVAGHRAPVQHPYKAPAAGIVVELIDEHDTSKTCPRCEHQYKPKGRVYCCPRCGLVAHREAVGSAHILSRTVHGKLASILPPPLAATTDRYPAWQGTRSPLATGELARSAAGAREAAGL
jgi:putative transposase